MKILFRLCFLVLIPIIVGLALTLSGHAVGSYVLAFGVPGVMIVLVIVGLIMMLTGKLFPKAPENAVSDTTEQSDQRQDQNAASDDNASPNDASSTVEQTDREKEEAALHDINSSRSYSNRYKLAEYEAQHIVEGTKNASKKGCAFGIILVILVAVDVVLAVTFTIKQIWVGAIVCAAIFGISVVGGLITVAVREAMSTHADISKAKKLIRGKVRSCIMSSMVQHKRASDPTVKVSNVVYRVVINGEGIDHEAYSKQFYDTDATVVIAVMGKKRAKIVEDADLDNQSEDFKNYYNTCLTTGDTVVIDHTSSSPTAGRSTHRHTHRRRH